MSRASVSQADYEGYLRNLGKPISGAKAPPSKKHKYGAKSVTVDGHKFPSLLEARCYTALKFQHMGGLITEPLLQVRFSLGKHYGRERFYVADFVFVEFRKERDELVIADAKGHRTEEYIQKKKMICKLYGIRIREYQKMRL